MDLEEIIKKIDLEDNESIKRVLESLNDAINKNAKIAQEDRTKDLLATFGKIIETLQELSGIDYYESEKAKEAWRLNKYNPIMVEDTALEILGLGGRPGTLTDYFTSDIEIRRLICEKWLGNDRRARAIVTLAIFDGIEVQTRQGITTGQISNTLLGSNGLSWDDMFIPDGQKVKNPRTFAEMSSREKNIYSMRLQ